MALSPGTVSAAKTWEVIEIVVPAPAAGADWSVTVPSGVVWKVRSIAALFNCSAAVANRTPAYQVTDGSRLLLLATGNINRTAGQGVYEIASAGQDATISFWPGPVFNADIFGFPVEYTLPPGAVISSLTNGLQVGDTWTNITLLVEQANSL